MLITRRKRARSVDSVDDARVFAGCSARQRARLHQLSTVVTVPAGRSLAEQGTIGREFGVILDGQAVVEIDGVEVAKLGNGDHYGELALLDDPQSPCTRRATVTTTGPTTVAAMTIPEFRTLLAEMPEAAARIMQIARQRTEIH